MRSAPRGSSPSLVLAWPLARVGDGRWNSRVAGGRRCGEEGCESRRHPCVGSPAEGKDETEGRGWGRQGQVRDDVGLRASPSSAGCNRPRPPPPVARPADLAGGTPPGATFPLTEGVEAGATTDGPAVIWRGTSSLGRLRLGLWRWLCDRVGYHTRVRKRLHVETRRRGVGHGGLCSQAWKAPADEDHLQVLFHTGYALSWRRALAPAPQI